MPQVQNPAVPNLPLAPREYDARQFEQLTRDLRTYFNKLRAAMDPLLLGFNHYGLFKHSATLTNASPGDEQLVEYDTTVEAFGVYVDGGNPTRIVVKRGGLYNFQFSAQLDHSSVSAVAFFLWFKKNGTAVDDSATKVVVAAGASSETFAAWNYLIKLEAGDYFELAWMSNEATAVISAFAASSPVPAIPAVIMTVNYLFPDDVR